MLRKIKDILGIEGVKIVLVLEDSYLIKEGLISGQLLFSSQNDKTIESIHVKLVEKYKRGRGDNVLVNMYTLGSLELQLNMPISKGENKVIDFELPFALMKSDMDRLEDGSFVSRPFVWLAKKLKNVNSSYHVEAEAIIHGTKLHPLDKKPVELK